MARETFTFLLSPLFLLLLPLTPHLHAVDLTHEDLERLSKLLSGEFDNRRQNERDQADSMTGNSLHYPIRKLHVPVRVPALQRVAGGQTITRQLYLQQYFYHGLSPHRQRIFNLVFTNTSIQMETHAPRNTSAAQQWEGWRQNRSLFEAVRVEDLAHDGACDVGWMRCGNSGHDADCVFTATTHGKLCTFNFTGTQVYVRSEVNLTDDKMIQDEHFLSLDDDSIVSGAATPYVFDKVNDLPPLPTLGPPTSHGQCSKRMLTCFLLQVTMSLRGLWLIT